MGSLWDLGTLEIMNSGAGLLFVDVRPEILAEEKEGMISESVPRTSGPLSLTPHPGTVLPALALPTEALPLGQDAEWQPHQHQRLVWLQCIQGHPQAARLLSGSLPTVQRKQSAKVCECNKKAVHRPEPHIPVACVSAQSGTTQGLTYIPDNPRK